ncbi:MAG: hypothetical protein KKC05_00790, partial [Nanoarchaeota archaeon]|nr:hypothetical protein [Nanoarchaeota archaeon]
IILVLLISLISVSADKGNNGNGDIDVVAFQGNQNGPGLKNSANDTNNTNQSNGTNQGVQENQNTQNQGEDQNLIIQERQQIRAQTTEELKQMIQQRQQEMSQEVQQLQIGVTQKNTYQNQNRVKLAVHAMLAMENLTGGIGQNISKIAKEFNNSVNKTIKSEEKIQNRDMFTKFFFGGDEVAAGEIENEVIQNQERIQELKKLRETCTCDEEVKNILQEQIQSLEQEQTRLNQLSNGEKSNKGLFGWLWK